MASGYEDFTNDQFMRLWQKATDSSTSDRNLIDELVQEGERRGLDMSTTPQAPAASATVPAVPQVGSLASPVASGYIAGQVAAPAAAPAASAAPAVAAPVAAVAPGTVLGVPLTAGGAGAVAGGAYTGYQQATGAADFLQGNSLKTPQKVALALPTFGTSLFSDQIQDTFGLGGKDEFKTEQNRLNKLKEAGVLGADYPVLELQQGRSKEELTRQDLPPDFVGFDPNGQWVNNKFAQSRNEKDLQGTDIQGFATFFENLGKEYADAPLQTKINIAQEALNRGLVNESTGTLNVKDDGSYWDWAKTQLMAGPAEAVPTGALVDGEGDEDVQVQLPPEGEGVAPVQKSATTDTGDLSPEAVALMELNSLLKKSGGRPRARSLILNSLLEQSSPSAVDSFSGSELGAGSLINSPLLN